MTDYYTTTSRQMLASAKEVGAMPFLLFQYYLTWQKAKDGIKPSLQRIAEDLGMEKNAVCNLRSRLIKAGWIRYENDEVFILKTFTKNERSFTKNERDHSQKMNDDSHHVNDHSQKMNEPFTKNESPYIRMRNKEEEIKEIKEEQEEKDISNEISKKKKPQIAFETFPIPRSDVETDLWSLFLESRARMKIPLTEGAYKKIVGQLEKIPLFDINDRLVEAVDRKWRGLIFPEDLQNGKLSPIEAKELINGRHQKPFTNAGDRNAERIQNSNGFIESLIAEAERIEQQNAFSGGDCEDHQENDFIVQPPALIGDGLGRTG
jgi:hypothetical protein